MKLSPKRAEVLSLVALVVQVLFFLFMLLISSWVHSLAVRIEAWHFLGGTAIWLILFLQFRQIRLSQEEKIDAEHYKRLKQEGKDTSVFEASTVETSLNQATRLLAWIEKYLIPIFSMVVSVFLLWIGYVMYRAVTNPLNETTVLANSDIVFKAATFILGFALISFLFSRYAVGMSQLPEWRPLRAGGSYLLSNALASFALTVILLLENAGYKQTERITSYVLVALIFLIGIEIIWNLMLDAFRPRVKGRYRRAPYESRILGLFSEPGGLFRSAAHAIDYQFGFKVSDTWFFKLIAKAVVPLIMLQILALYLLTTLAIVEPGNVGVLERFGQPVNISSPYSSGMYLKWPWPIDQIRSFPIEQEQSLKIGFEPKEPQYDKNGREILDTTPILWTVDHWEEEYPFMVAATPDEELLVSTTDKGENFEQNDFDMLVVALGIDYRIRDIGQYGYGEDHCYANPADLIESICYRETIHYCATSTMENLLGSGRRDTSNTLKELFQARVDEYGMGIDITFVGLEAVHPPVRVATEFEKVVSALQDKQAKILAANGESRAILAEARGKSAIRKSQADAYAVERAKVAQAVGERFKHQVEAYEKGGDVYLWREYLSVLDEMLPPIRKYVIMSNHVNNWVYELDLKEKLQPDIFDGLGLPDEEQEK